MRLADSVAKWVAGVGGVTLAVAISFSSSAYTSFIQVYDKCQTRLIASDATLGGRSLGLFAVIGASTALAGLAWPHVSKQIWYSFHSGRTHRYGNPGPVLDDWHPTIFTANLHSVLIALGFCIVAAVLLAALSIFKRQTSEGLARYVQNIEAKCASAKQR